MAENLIRLSGRNTDDEQREVYAYGLECCKPSIMSTTNHKTPHCCRA